MAKRNVRIKNKVVQRLIKVLANCQIVTFSIAQIIMIKGVSNTLAIASMSKGIRWRIVNYRQLPGNCAVQKAINGLLQKRWVIFIGYNRSGNFYHFNIATKLSPIAALKLLFYSKSFYSSRLWMNNWHYAFCDLPIFGG